MFNTGSDTTTRNARSSNIEGESTIMSTIDSIKNATFSRIAVRSLAIIGTAAIVITSALGSGAAGQAEESKISSEWLAFVEWESYGNQFPGSTISAPVTMSPEWAAHVAADLEAAQVGNFVYGAPLGVWNLSPEWAAHLELDAREMAGRTANAIAKPFVLSSEWSAHLEFEALNGYERSVNALGQ
jgi:hypothetical protein